MKVAIIGGGTMGMTLAYRLSQAGYRVTVFEQEPQLGGLATWCDYGDFVWDKYYHVICRHDADLLQLIDELGLASEVRWAETKTGFLWRGRLLSMSSNREFLAFPALSLFDKFRLATGILRCRRTPASPELEATKAAPWLQSLFGRNVYRAIWEPLLESKYGSLKESIPATIMWATINRYYSTRSKGDGKEKMGYLQNSLKALYEAMREAVVSSGGTVNTSAPVEYLDASNASSVQVRADGATRIFDRAISTQSWDLLSGISPDAARAHKARSSKPSYLGVICLALVLRKPLTSFYVTNLIQKGFPFTGIIEVSNLCGERALNGRHLLMLPRYDVPESPWFDKSSEEITEEFVENLQEVFPDIRESIVGNDVRRERFIQSLWINSPPPPVLEPWVSENGSIWSVNAELTGRDTLNNNAIVRAANEAAQKFMRFNPLALAASA